ncbi:hypothetical protein C0J52_00812 [Blattella germanica]|nr:hypothetical protein C0J52_00812 [Blattella germanica]
MLTRIWQELYSINAILFVSCAGGGHIAHLKCNPKLRDSTICAPSLIVVCLTV